MLLVLAATEFEMMAFKSVFKADERVMIGVCGVGPVEAAVRTTRILEDCCGNITSILNFGIGGAYLTPDRDGGAGLLDICLAESEVLGDYGVCYGNRMESFGDRDLAGHNTFKLDKDLLDIARLELSKNNIDGITGSFITVNGASGCSERGNFLRDCHNGICENMEGAAIARCCVEYSLPMLEVRSISNMVEDRPGKPWKLQEACSRSGLVAALIAERIKEQT